MLSALNLRARPQKIQKYHFLSKGLCEHLEQRGVTCLGTGAPGVHFSAEMTKMPLVSPKFDWDSKKVQTFTKQCFS